MVKVGTADGWCATCLDEAAETAQAQVIERVRALGDKTAEWYPTNRRRITVDELRAALDAAPTPPTEAKGCGHTFPDGTACSLSAEAHAMPGMAHHCIPPTTDEEARLKFLDEAEADLFPTPTATGAHAWDPETPCPCGRPDTCPATPPTTDAEES